MIPLSENTQNFLKQVPEEKPNWSLGSYKAFLFDILAVVSALALGFAFNLYLKGSVSAIVVFTIFLFFGIFSTLEAYLIKEFKRRVLVIIIEAAAFLSFFTDQSFETLGIILGVLLFFFFWGEFASRAAQKNSLRLTFLWTSRRQLGKIITGFVFAATILYLPLVGPADSIISDDSFGVLFGWASGITTRFYPEINLNSTTGEAIKSLVMFKLKKIPEFDELSTEDQQSSISKNVNEVTALWGKNIKMTINGDERIKDLSYKAVVNFLDGLRGKFGEVFLVSWGILFFFFVRGIGVLVVLISSLLAYVVFQIMAATGFVKIYGESTMKEVAKI